MTETLQELSNDQIIISRTFPMRLPTKGFKYVYVDNYGSARDFDDNSIMKRPVIADYFKNKNTAWL